ncbi:hypothetical protein UY3_11381 [Chelonia mydas]|uniref:Uncharacterized protein n=1 Tax=Chelonia mydas TaxID=8469 RepID=M7BTI8_CHEMY|nr:hypothetical protein UY3_11381 [Chelonia mydas]
MLALLGLWGEEAVQAQLQGTCRNVAVYEKIGNGYDSTHRQCCFYNNLHAILGGDPNPMAISVEPETDPGSEKPCTPSWSLAEEETGYCFRELLELKNWQPYPTLGEGRQLETPVSKVQEGRWCLSLNTEAYSLSLAEEEQECAERELELPAAEYPEELEGPEKPAGVTGPRKVCLRPAHGTIALHHPLGARWTDGNLSQVVENAGRQSLSLQKGVSARGPLKPPYLKDGDGKAYQVPS